MFNLCPVSSGTVYTKMNNKHEKVWFYQPVVSSKSLQCNKKTFSLRLNLSKKCLPQLLKSIRFLECRIQNLNTFLYVPIPFTRPSYTNNCVVNAISKFFTRLCFHLKLITLLFSFALWTSGDSHEFQSIVLLSVKETPSLAYYEDLLLI